MQIKRGCNQLVFLLYQLKLAIIFNFGKYLHLTVCQSVCPSVCLSVCLPVRINVVSWIQVATLDQSSPNLTQMCILVISRNPFIMYVKGWIIGSRGQKVGNALGYQYSIPNFRWHSRRKSSTGHQNFVTSQNFKILKISKGSLNLTSDMERRHANNLRKIFSCWWRQLWRHTMTTKSAFYIHV